MLILGLIAGVFKECAFDSPYRGSATSVDDSAIPVSKFSPKEVIEAKTPKEVIEVEDGSIKPSHVIEEIVWEDFVSALRSQLFVAQALYDLRGIGDGSVKVKFSKSSNGSESVTVGSKSVTVKLDLLLRGDEDADQISVLVRDKIVESTYKTSVSGVFPEFRVSNATSCSSSE